MRDLNEIEALDDEIAKLQAKRKLILEEKRKDAIKMAKELIKSFELSISELGLSGTSPANSKISKKPRIPKYRNPADPNQTWGGGAKPKWVIEYEKKGGKLEDLLINKK